MPPDWPYGRLGAPLHQTSWLKNSKKTIREQGSMTLTTPDQVPVDTMGGRPRNSLQRVWRWFTQETAALRGITAVAAIVPLAALVAILAVLASKA